MEVSALDDGGAPGNVVLVRAVIPIDLWATGSDGGHERGTVFWKLSIQDKSKKTGAGAVFEVPVYKNDNEL